MPSASRGRARRAIVAGPSAVAARMSVRLPAHHWDIDTSTEQEGERAPPEKEFNERTQLFMNALDVDEMVGQVLASKALPRSRNWPMSSPTRSPRSMASRERPRGNPEPPRVTISSAPGKRDAGPCGRTRRLGRNCARSTAMTARMMVRARRGRHQDDRGLRRLCRRRPGWLERNARNGETKRFEGLFSKLDVSRTEAEAMIVQARLSAGWITEADLAGPAEAEEAVEEAE